MTRSASYLAEAVGGPKTEPTVPERDEGAPPGTTVLVDCFNMCGAAATPHVPGRLGALAARKEAEGVSDRI